MNLLGSIADRVDAHRRFEQTFIGKESKMPMTVYLGEIQMEELRELVKQMPSIRTENLVQEPMLMGMNLVEVKRKDYLRVI